ncbi:unnamed protein product [Porites lobata]|uniref:G-protein coupled receptors family 1 profile domain-containing protein n=1 Tax=Porites lobata TaxID=104759 RepID=A0ABN8RQZ9_9CNID|nr:unnamed protein product [Porites lobata]
MRPGTGNPNKWYRKFRTLEPEKEKCNLYGLAWRAEYLQDDTYKHLVALICIDIIAALPTILLNALVIFAVATRHRLRNNGTILLACLAGTDLLTGLIVLPFSFSLDWKRLLGVGPFCSPQKALIVIITMVAFASFSHLVVISIDRYIAIKYPLRYQDIVTETRIITSVVLAWGFTLLMTINELALALIDSETIYSIYSQVNILIEIVIMTLFTAAVLWSYGYIYSETRRQVKRLKAEQLPQEEIQRIKKDRKAATTLAIILIALVFTYLPAIITGILATLPVSTVVPPRLRVIIWSWVAISIMSGSLANPIIYCWRMKNLRRAFLEILHLRKAENTMPETEIQGTQRNQTGPRGNLAFSLPENGQPVLLSFRQLQVEYIPRIDEANEN